MKKTIYHGFLMPEGTDAVDVQNFNDNFEDVDEILHDLEQNTGDISKSTVNATIATTRTNVASGDSIGTIVGKIMKWFTDIKDAAFCAVANNLTTTAAGSVLDARQGKALNDSLTTHNTQLGGLYFGTNSAGKWGYKTSPNGSVIPFRQPTGNAGTGDVLVGKTFANASSDALTGTMPNNGSMTATLTPTGNNTVTKTIPAGYTTGGTITANGATAYAAGRSSVKMTKVGTITLSASQTNSAMSATVNIGTGYDSSKLYLILTDIQIYNGGSGKASTSFTHSYDSSSGVLTVFETGALTWNNRTFTFDVYHLN